MKALNMSHSTRQTLGYCHRTSCLDFYRPRRSVRPCSLLHVHSSVHETDTTRLMAANRQSGVAGQPSLLTRPATSSSLYQMQFCNNVDKTHSTNITSSSATAKSTARTSCLVGVLYNISLEKIC